MQTIKCVVVGNGCVGKTCLIKTYMSAKCPAKYQPATFKTFPEFIDDPVSQMTVMIRGEQYDLTLTDTPGQEDFDRLRPLYYLKADVFLVCFSVVSPASLQTVKQKWLPEITQHCPKIPFILVGMKIDMKDDPKTIGELLRRNQEPTTPEQGEEMAKKLKAVTYVECSALTRKGVMNVFDKAMLAAIEPPLEPPKKKKCTLL